MKRIGVIVVLIGIGLFLISILFSEGSFYHQRSIIENIRSMEWVIYRGRPVYRKRIVLEGVPLKKVEEVDIFKGYRGKVVISLNLMVSLTIIITLVGAGMIIVNPSKQK
jgi:hypothetical protein